MNKIAIVIGGAETVYHDMIFTSQLHNDIYLKLFSTFYPIAHRELEVITIAVNDIACHTLPNLDHWVTLHPEKFNQWKNERTKRGFSILNTQTWCRNLRKCDHVISTKEEWKRGSSGLLGVQVAFEKLKADKIILCGIPLDPNYRFFHETTETHVIDKNKKWYHADKYWKAWEERIDLLKTKVRSMSGRTCEVFGEPTLEWLLSKEEENVELDW